MQNVPQVAVLGAGPWGKNLIRNFARLGALRAVCEVDDETRKRLSAEYPDVKTTPFVEEILTDREVKGVVIATPVTTHAALVRQALTADKDVFVEKPLCLSPEEGEELIALAAHKERILMVGHLLWYHPAVLKLKKLIQAGELGRIQYIYSHRLNLGRIRRQEDILWSFAPHDVSLILGLLGEMPDAILAQGGNYLHQMIADVTVSLLTFPSGVKAHIFVSWLHPYKEQKLIVVGDRKMAVFNDLEQFNKLLVYPHSITWKNGDPIANKAKAESIPLDDIEPLRAECSHFLECVGNRTRPRTDGEEGLRVLTVLRLCHESMKSGGRHASISPAQPRRPYSAHESAFVDEGVEIGEGTTIWHVSHILRGSQIGRHCRIGQNVIIGPNVTIGDGVKIQNNVSVYEGVTLEDNVFCGPSMVFTNVLNPRSEIRRMHELKPTRVKRGATLGANCTIVCGLTIGVYAFVGAGAVVTKDVPDYALVVGNPGRVAGWVCQCGVRLAEKESIIGCPACGRAYRRGRSGLMPLAEESQGEKAV